MQKRKPATGVKDHTTPKTKGLQQEAADMEAKLLELRKAMELERARRETLMAAAGNGAMWRSGASGLLRTNFRNKQVASAGSSHSTSATLSNVGSISGGAASQPVTGGPGRIVSAPTGRQLSEGTGISGRSDSMSGRGDQVPPTGFYGLQPEAVRIVTPPPQRPPRHHTVAEVMSIHDQDGIDSMACGADAGDDLASGVFNEADSHKSFLEALNEWRNGNSNDSSKNTAIASTSKPSAGANSEAQTETSTSKASAPALATSKKSFFEKLALNTASREAGQSATTGPEIDVSAARHTIDNKHVDPQETQSPIDSRLAVLYRLEQLEKAQEAVQLDDDDEGDDEIEVTTQVSSLGLIKGMRLPDAIMLPSWGSAAGERE